jgi:hypothetical protein
MTHRRSLLAIFRLLVIAALAACNPIPPTYSQTVPLISTPYTIVVIPTPSAPDQCTITGVLLVKPGPKPVSRMVLALANVIESDGTPVASSMDSLNPQRTLTDDNGRFVFTQVPVDTYTLIFDQITESFLLSHPTSGEDMLINCEDGQVIDLGNLVYSELPIPTPVK